MARKNPWLFVIAGALTVVGVLALGLWAYWRYANELPSYSPPRVVLPAPNAYDDYRRAGALCRAAGGAAVVATAGGRSAASSPRAATVPPAVGPAGSGRTMEGYEDSVPLEQVRAVVARNRPALALLRQGFHEQYLTPPVLSFQQPFPELATFRELARVLVTEGKLAEREGRMSDAARSCLDCLRLGLDVQRGGLLIHGLVAIAVQAIGMSAMEDVTDRLDGPTAAAAAREMIRLDRNASTAADAAAAEKEFGTVEMLEIMRQAHNWRTLSSMFQGGFPSTFSQDISQWLKFSFTPKRQIIADQRAYMDAVVANARKPYYARTALPPIPDDLMNRSMLPVFAQATLKWDIRDALWRILETRLAARAYQAQRSEPPPSLAALVPEYLPAVPRDPFANRPLVYRVNGSEPVVYSRGPDGKDDGGLDVGSRAAPGTVGDIVTVRGRPRRLGPRGRAAG